MKVLVLGSGVIGVSSAYQLAHAGHQVTVVDRQPAAGLETSFANAGEVSPGYSSPWAAPGIPLKALRWMFQRHAPLVLRPQADPAMWRWLAQMLANCTSARYELNKGRMLRLAAYSREVLAGLRAETGIEYDQRTRGTLQLFRTRAQLDACAKDTTVLDRFGVRYRLLDVDGCIAAEPGLGAVRAKIAGGLHLPGDETGDCFKFTTELARLARALGVAFRNSTGITRIERDGDLVTGVLTDAGRLHADAYVVALGSYSPRLLAPLGLRVPVYPIKGYSITLPVTDPSASPESTIMDETHKVAITRLGDRIRVAGMAEITGYDLSLRERRLDTVRHVVRDLFPDGGDLARAEPWTGLRPMTPDGTPIVGATGYRNLWLNTGHGTLGWTMACGSASLLADLLSGRRPEIDPEGLGLDRYQRDARQLRPSYA
jgi:D-amino-acid dehydrogenase